MSIDTEKVKQLVSRWKEAEEKLEQAKKKGDELKKALRLMLFGFNWTHDEKGVIFAFGRLYEHLHLNFDRLDFKSGYPDAIGTRGDEKTRIEFELSSKGFKQHGHDPEECDLIVCWKHDWSECPIEVMELSMVDPNLKGRIHKPEVARNVVK